MRPPVCPYVVPRCRMISRGIIDWQVCVYITVEWGTFISHCVNQMSCTSQRGGPRELKRKRREKEIERWEREETYHYVGIYIYAQTSNIEIPSSHVDRSNLPLHRSRRRKRKATDSISPSNLPSPRSLGLFILYIWNQCRSRSIYRRGKSICADIYTANPTYHEELLFV